MGEFRFRVQASVSSSFSTALVQFACLFAARAHLTSLQAGDLVTAARLHWLEASLLGR